MERNYYIVLGGPEHLEFVQKYEEQPVAEQWFWTVPKDARDGDAAFVYLTAPVSRIVGKLLIIGEPFFNVNEFENPKTKKKWMVEIRPVAYFGSRPELTMRGLRALFPDWAWLSYPRSAARMPDEIIQPFLELTSGETPPREGS